MSQEKSTKKISKIGGLIGAFTISASMLFTALPSGEAQAVGSFPYDGLNSNNSNHALNLAYGISNNSISIKHVTNPKASGYEAIGRVSNMDGWKGPRKDSMGTGFIIDSHTFLTNSHVVERANGKIASPHNVKIVTERNGKSKKYTFNAKKITKAPGADIVVVHTYQDMSRLVKPLKLASTKEVKAIKKGTNIKAPGYDIIKNGDNTQLWESHGKALTKTSNGKELMTKQIFRNGGSGSPMLNSKNQVLGIMAYGFNLGGNGGYAEANQELSGGFTFDGSTRSFITKHMK